MLKTLADATGAGTGWRARLELDFSVAAGRTRLARRHVGPLVVQRPFHPEADGTCHVYVLHPPGGVAGGDALALDVTVAADARAVLTTPGATKFYRGGGATQRVGIDVAPGGVCEWLPAETILFDGARARIQTDVRLQGDAVFTGWEIVSLGRPAADETFGTGHLQQGLSVLRDGRPVWFERMRLAAGDPAMRAVRGLGGQPIVGTMLHAGAMPENAAERIRAVVPSPAVGLFSVSQLDGVLVCRFLGPKLEPARRAFAQAWDVLRRAGQGKAAVAPRIWST